MYKETLIDLLQQAYQQRNAFIDGLPEAERAAVGASDHWAAKDIVAHTVEWDKRAVDLVEAAARGEPVPTFADDDTENAGIFAAYQGVSWDELRQIAQETHMRMIQFIWTAADDDLSDPQLSPWKDGSPMWYHFAGTYLTHPAFHFAGYHLEHGRPERAVELSETYASLWTALDASPSWQGTVRYNQACLYALAGRSADAISALGEALTLNPGLIAWSKEDADLASIRSEPGYRALYD